MKTYYLNLAAEEYSKGNMRMYYYYIWLAGKEKGDE